MTRRSQYTDDYYDYKEDDRSGMKKPQRRKEKDRSQEKRWDIEDVYSRYDDYDDNEYGR